MIAAFISTYRYEGRKGVILLWSACASSRGLAYIVLALFAPFLLNLAAFMLQWWQTGIWGDISRMGVSREFPAFNLLSFFLYNVLFFGFGEEVGWRGFALPRLQKRFNALSATLMLTFFWAAWHIPMFFYRPGYTNMDISGIVGWIASLLTGSVLLTWFFNSSRGSLMACAIFHATIDIAFTSDFATSEIVQLTGMFITIWGVIVILVFKPAHLSLNERITRLDQ